MSLKREVPAVVPSVFHSSKPCTPSFAAKKKLPATPTPLKNSNESPEPKDPGEPGQISFKRNVPASVPSVRQTSHPWAASLARKYMIPSSSACFQTSPSSSTNELNGPPRMSLTITVPASVPSVLQSSHSWTPSFARKSALSPKTTGSNERPKP